jgi:hypothetical protein
MGIEARVREDARHRERNGQRTSAGKLDVHDEVFRWRRGGVTASAR